METTASWILVYRMFAVVQGEDLVLTEEEWYQARGRMASSQGTGGALILPFSPNSLSPTS